MHVEPKSEVLQLHPNHAGDNDLRRPPGRSAEIFALCALRKMVETAELLMLFLDVLKGSGQLNPVNLGYMGMN